MSRIRIGVIGAGNMGKNHIRVLDSMSEFELIGLYDTNTAGAKSISSIYNVRAFESIDTLLEHVDAVTIAVPSFLHKEVALKAANAGRHILLEKPIALTVPDAQQIIDACQAKGIVLMVGHVERFNPAIIELMKVIEHEEIFSLDFRRMSPYDPRVSDANVIQDLMIHDIDVLNALVNSPIKRIFSQGVNVFSDKLDYVQAMIEFDNGILASITASRATESKVRVVEINAKGAYIVTNFLDRTIDIMRKTRFVLDVGHSTSYRQENVIEKVFVPMGEPLRNEMQHFADCINKGITPATDGNAAIKALRVCENVLQIALQGGQNEFF